MDRNSSEASAESEAGLVPDVGVTPGGRRRQRPCLQHLLKSWWEAPTDPGD